MRKKIIIGNWKMNPTSPKEARNIFLKIRNTARRLRKVETVVCPPFVYLEQSSKLSRGVSLGAQDAFWEREGARTGEVSPTMLANTGVKYVILGHSERRALGDTNEMVNRKIKLALEHRLFVILCVGEKERDTEGQYYSFLREQVVESLRRVPAKYYKNIFIAYEPVWAIGARARGASTPEDFLEKSIFIRKVIYDTAGAPAAQDTPILYGGSVNEKNAAGFLREGKGGGLLIGRASRDPHAFSSILKDVNTLRK